MFKIPHRKVSGYLYGLYYFILISNIVDILAIITHLQKVGMIHSFLSSKYVLEDYEDIKKT